MPYKNSATTGSSCGFLTGARSTSWSLLHPRVAPSRPRLPAFPLPVLDTSIELAGAFERALPAALELAREWGADMMRVFGGDVRDLDDVARRLEPLLAGRRHRRARDARPLRERRARRRADPDSSAASRSLRSGTSTIRRVSASRRRMSYARSARRPAGARERRAAAERRLGARPARRRRRADP